jgi:hypothetical protein
MRIVHLPFLLKTGPNRAEYRGAQALLSTWAAQSRVEISTCS